MNEYVGVEGASGVLRIVLSDEGKSGATLTVYEGEVRVHVSVWMQRWVGPRYQLMKKALPSLPALSSPGTRLLVYRLRIWGGLSFIV